MDLLALNQRFNQEEPFLFKSVMGNSQVKQVTGTKNEYYRRQVSSKHIE